jgi:hypothetical protein
VSAPQRRRRAVWALAATAAAGAAATLAYCQVNGRDQSAAGPLGPALPGFAVRAEDVAQYVITTPDGAYRLARGGSHWVVLERGGFPAAPQKIEALTAGLAALKLSQVLTRDPKKFDALSLSDPRQNGVGVLISAADSNGAEIAALLVGRSPQGLVVRRPGSDAAYAATGALPDLRGPAAFLDLDALRISPERVRSVEIIPADEPAFRLSRADALASFSLEGQKRVKNAPVSAGFALDAVAFALTPFTPEDAVEIAPDAAPPGALIGKRRIITFEGLAVDLAFSEEGDTLWATAEAGGGGLTSEAMAINSRATGWAFAFPAADRGRLLPGRDALPGAATQIGTAADR